MTARCFARRDQAPAGKGTALMADADQQVRITVGPADRNAGHRSYRGVDLTDRDVRDLVEFLLDYLKAKGAE